MRISRNFLFTNLLLLGLSGAAVCTAQTGHFRANLNCLTFHLPDDTSYLELQYLIYGDGLNYKEVADGKFQGTVRADLTLKAIDGSIPLINKTFHFITAEYPDNLTSNKRNNYNLSRIPLPSKKYELYLCLRDANDSSIRPICHQTTIDLTFDRNRVSASSLQLIGAYSEGRGNSIYSKNGISLIPYFSQYFPAQTDTITFMWEIYNTDKVFPKDKAGWIVSKIVPEDIPLTSFSILMARYKGFLQTAVPGAAAVSRLKDGDRVLVSEGCTHHRQCGDIGTVKIPAWLKKCTGAKLKLEFTSGKGFPDDLSPYKMIIHCGGCMLNGREMQYRMKCAMDQGIPFTNYGTFIAYIHGILRRSIGIFPDLVKELDSQAAGTAE